ncbi:unnamed protein product [Rotaria magnacalcarata]|uniref:Uncharacterized protein n=1 Tax=Rotaria magnacalcarata TaxID=392030 RepID=A0A820ASY2_9BILA|nr:unnamed protein product [Rotaria magnacalcarata]CAF4195517.1 unnamed protein product [Rotaria magnacalcarata]
MLDPTGSSRNLVKNAQLDFHSFLALLRSMLDVIRIEHKENKPPYCIHSVYNEIATHIQKMVLEQHNI